MKFRKKPVVIEAEQFFAHQKPWPEGVEPLGRDVFGIVTFEGTMYVSEGDWIITSVSGEKFIWKPDIFEKTYEPVEEGDK